MCVYLHSLKYGVATETSELLLTILVHLHKPNLHVMISNKYSQAIKIEQKTCDLPGLRMPCMLLASHLPGWTPMRTFLLLSTY